MEDELTVIEAVFTYIDTQPVLMIKTAPTPDYDSGKKALAWVQRVRTGKHTTVIAMHPVDGVNGATEAEHKPTCHLINCAFDEGHDGDHEAISLASDR